MNFEENKIANSAMIIIILYICFSSLSAKDFKQLNFRGAKLLTNSEIVNDNNDKKKITQISKQFFSKLFCERDVLGVFQNYTAFDKWDDTDDFASSNELFATSLKEDLPQNFSDKTKLRIAVAIWKDNFQHLYHSFGKHLIDNSDDAFPYKNDYDVLRKKVLKKNNSSISNFDFKGKNETEVKKILSETEKNFDDIEKLIFERIDESIYKKNINIILKSIEVKKIIVKDRNYYLFGIPKPYLGFLLTKKQNSFKVIGLITDT